MLFHRRRNRRARSCWVRPWLSAERRLQYGHYDRLLAELRIEAFFNFMQIPPEMLSARHFLTAISSCFATYLTLIIQLCKHVVAKVTLVPCSVNLTGKRDTVGHGEVTINNARIIIHD